MKISVHIKPNAKHDEGAVVLEDGTYEVRVKAPAVEGRANAAACEVLAKHFGVSKSRVRLVNGATSRYKVFEVEES